MKILILHHIEPMWENSFRHWPEDYFLLIGEHLEEEHYDKVILTTLEYTGGYDAIKHLWDTEEEWSYAWEDPAKYPEWYSGSNIDMEDMIPASGHEFAYLYPWIKELSGNDIHLAGGGEGECLQDLIDSLDHLEIPYKKIYNLIY